MKDKVLRRWRIVSRGEAKMSLCPLEPQNAGNYGRARPSPMRIDHGSPGGVGLHNVHISQARPVIFPGLSHDVLK